MGSKDVIQESQKREKVKDKIIFALFFSTVFFGSLAIYFGTYRKILLVPPFIGEPTELREGEILPDYLEEYAIYIAMLSQNFTYHNFEAQYKRILSRVDPSVAGSMMSNIIKQYDEVRTREYSRHFDISKIDLDIDALQAKVYGIQTRYQADVEVFKGPKVIVMTFTQNRFGLFLKNMTIEEGM